MTFYELLPYLTVLINQLKMTYYLLPGVFLKVNKKNISFTLFLTGILVCLCSCASTAAARKNQPYIWLTNSSKYILLPPENIENPMDSHQLVSASWGGNTYQASAWVKADETGIDMSLMNELGAGMGELSYRGGSVTFSSPVFPGNLTGEYITADFQFCFYNTPALRKALKDCGLSFEDTGKSRRILKGETPIVEIEKSKDAVRLVNLLRGYTFTLEGTFE